jgi:hypothetical protein
VCTCDTVCACVTQSDVESGYEPVLSKQFAECVCAWGSERKMLQVKGRKFRKDILADLL